MVQKNITLLIGETASGKTEFISEYSSQHKIEVVNCDSRQIYRYCDIGTAKPSRELQKKVKHHIIDVAELNSEFSAGMFIDEFTKIKRSGRETLISAGTPFYLNVLLNGLDEIPHAEKNIRRYVEAMSIEKGAPYLYRLLEKHDPKRASQLAANDSQRIKRALEVYFQTGTPMSDFLVKKSEPLIRPAKVIYLKRSREELEARVRRRTSEMIKNGLAAETEMLVKKYGMETVENKRIIGYAEIIEYLKGGCTSDEAEEKIVRNTMRYIKRQRTFFKSILAGFYSEGRVEEA